MRWLKETAQAWFGGNGIRASGPAQDPVPNDLQHPEQWSVHTFGGGSSVTGLRVTERTSLTLPAVLQAVRILTGVFSMTPLIYYRRTSENGKERATEEALYSLFKERPNRSQTAFAFKEVLLSDILLTGTFAAYISRDRAQVPVALTRLDPKLIGVNTAFDRATGQHFIFDVTLPDGTRDRLGASDIWYIPGLSRDGVTGLDIPSVMSEALGGGLATQEFANRFFANNAKPDLILSAEGKIPSDAKERLRADWYARQGGVHNAHKMAVVDQGLKPHLLVTDNEKNQMVETRTFQVIDIARAFGVPPHLLFELSKATFSNIEHQSLEFLLYHMSPHYQRVAEAATVAFAEDGHFFEFLPDALLKGDIKTRWEAYRAAREVGVLSADEIRARENLNPIGGDVGEGYVWSANFTPAGIPPSE